MTNTYNLGLVGPGITIGYGAATVTSGVVSAPGSFTTIGQVKSIEFPQAEMGMWDTTGLGSVATEQIPTMYKAGELSFVCITDPAATDQIALIAGMSAKTLYAFKASYPAAIGSGSGTAKTAIWFGYLSKHGQSGAETESGIETTFTVALTGVPTYA